MEATSAVGGGVFGGEQRKWWTLGAVSFGLFMIMLDNTVVNVALPSIQRDLGIVALRARVGRHRLRAHVRRAHADGRQARRPARPAAHVRRRPRRLHRRVARVRARRQRRHADRRARRPGRRRGADEPGDALDHHRDVPAAAARARRSGSGPASRRSRSRSGRSSAASSPSTSTGAGSSSSTSRSASSRSSRPSCSSTSRATPRASSGSDLPGLVTSGGRPLRAHVRADRGEHLRLGLAADPRAVRARGGLARRVRPARAAPAACRCST